MLAELLFPDICVACECLLTDDPEVPLCRACRVDLGRLPIESRRVGDIEALYPYDGGLARALRRLKFSDQPALAGPLGRMLGTARSWRGTPAGAPWDLCCNVPLHHSRVWSRGYDQAQLLARWAQREARRSGLPAPAFRPRTLRRRRATAAQSELGLADRLANLAGAFEVRDAEAVRGKRVLVIDDVTTSGATLYACFEALRAGGASELGGLCLMRTLEDGEALRAEAQATKGTKARRSLG